MMRERLTEETGGNIRRRLQYTILVNCLMQFLCLLIIGIHFVLETALVDGVGVGSCWEY